MSESEKERSEVAGGGGHGREDHERKAKWVSLFRFRKVKNKLHRRNKRPSNSSSSTTVGFTGKRVCVFGGCYLCFKQPQTLDSPIGSHTSDPNNPEFGHELLRALIEKNDFYSKECNPHKDIDTELGLVLKDNGIYFVPPVLNLSTWNKESYGEGKNMPSNGDSVEEEEEEKWAC